MRKLIVSRSSTATLAALVALTFASFGTAADTSPAASTAQRTAMQAWQRAAAVGSQHQRLEWFKGRWKERVQMWMEPGQPPRIEQGVAEVRPVLGGRFMEMRHRGHFMGKPMQGLGYSGYDNLSGRYTDIWMDDGSTAIFVSHGDYDAAGKTWTYHGQMQDPLQPGTTIPVREVVRITGPRSYVFEWHETRDGRERKAMQIDYTRL
ncbi:DUF1579 domain-containing protein [Metallibacterium sp.]|uniref:DUF1579 domain-containing protein n=1 Tax=Metallibacterium sp. TaxID=2940281 RepID=UPI00260AFA8E|nr:DUF1579 domain-containing protein [Metallibacterium sp.]